MIARTNQGYHRIHHSPIFVKFTKMLLNSSSYELQHPNADFEIYEDKVMSARGRLRTLRNELQAPVKEEQSISLAKLVEQQASFLQQFTAAPIQAAAPKESDLPKIIIPPFTGQYKAWPSFKDLFVSAVHEKANLTNTQKFHYLKSFLEEEAARMFMHIPVTDKSYDTAWARLNERYDRPRHIVASFIETFVALSSTINEDVKALRKISAGANEVIRGLDAIGRGGRDCWLIYWLESKLYTESRRKWIEESKEVSVPTITDFFKFLDSRCEELELTHPKPSLDGKISSPSSNKLRNSTARAFVSIDDCSATHKCIKCGSTNHTIQKCPTFSSMSFQDRRLLVKDKSLCFNCLRAGHTSSTCVSKFRCRRCNRRHHTMLHAESSGPIPEVPSTAPAASPHVSVTPVASTTADEAWKSYLNVIAHLLCSKCMQLISRNMPHVQ
ncbi:uncharacterized protein LOC118749691 [Rhagoletis pomonella]|uniref:uncharacterized protein LOC118749691 n=1 Tax=Rhagoletis pomonella TaxID=28610 RepID=UPI0017824D4D|nr:uncharacterized protein LOC118749691 [Rhagoletis pomonella]